MATVLIIATDQMIGGLLGQLTDLAGHAAQFGRETEEPSESVRHSRPDLVLLDAAFGRTTIDAVAAAASDVRAPVVYFAAALSASELRRVAFERGAKYFPLPAGPRLLGRVLASALGTDGSTGDGVVSAAHYAVTAAVAAVGRARTVAERAAALKTTSQGLRADHESLLADCRQSSAELREAVIAYTRELRAAGVPPDRTLELVKDALRSDVSGPGAPPGLEDATEWCLQAYYAA